MTATTVEARTPTESHPPTPQRRPPLVKSVPFIGPVRQFLGDVLPFLMETRAHYGDAFRLRMFTLEMTCLCGPDAIELLEGLELLEALLRDAARASSGASRDALLHADAADQLTELGAEAVEVSRMTVDEIAVQILKEGHHVARTAD